jgi:hypothetical protein
MAKIISMNSAYFKALREATHTLNGKSAYSIALSEAIWALRRTDKVLYSMMIGLTVSGKWKEWDEKQPEGTIFTFTEEMLRNTGDENVDALCELRDKLCEVRRKLKSNLRNLRGDV